MTGKNLPDYMAEKEKPLRQQSTREVSKTPVEKAPEKQQIKEKTPLESKSEKQPSEPWYKYFLSRPERIEQYFPKSAQDKERVARQQPSQEAKKTLVEKPTTWYSKAYSLPPNWFTNNPRRFYWHSGKGAIYCETVESAEEYATIPITWDGNSFDIEFDIMIANSQWASGISIGLFDSHRHDSKPHVVDVVYGHSDDGLHVNIQAANSIVRKGAPYRILKVQERLWYRNRIFWDKNTGIVTFILLKKDGGKIATFTIDGFHSFASTMKHLGVSWVGHNASSNRTISYISDLKFQNKFVWAQGNETQ
jgi:hypothetical protein